MYHTFFGLRRAPFQQRPDPRYFVEDERVRGASDLLERVLAHGEGIAMLTGAAGVGKTMLLRACAERGLDKHRVVYVAANARRGEDPLLPVATALGLPATWRSRHPSLLQAMSAHLARLRGAGSTPALLLDECDALEAAALEQIRVLSDQPFEQQRLLPLVLCGGPEFAERLKQPALRALRSRIVQGITLAPLSKHRIADYLALRLRRSGYYGPDLFPRPVAHAIHRRCRGLPRDINALADATLIAAFAEGSYSLSRHHVRTAVGIAAARSDRARRHAPAA